MICTVRPSQFECKGFTTFKRYAIYLLGMLLVKHVMAEQNTGYMDPVFTLTLFQVSVPFSNRMARHDGPFEGQGGGMP